MRPAPKPRRTLDTSNSVQQVSSMPAPARAVAAAVLLSFFAAAAPLAAQPAAAPPTAAAKAEAATRFKKGLDLFKDGDYQAALIEFRRAYDLAPNYQVLYNIGQVSFQLQDYPGALAALQRYLTEGGRNVPGTRRAEVERDIEKLKQRVANLEIVVNVEGADITVDDVSVGKSPLGKPLLVSAGKHRVTVARAGYTSGAKLVEIASSDSQKVDFQLTETQSAAPAPISADRRPGAPVSRDAAPRRAAPRPRRRRRRGARTSRPRSSRWSPTGAGRNGRRRHGRDGARRARATRRKIARPRSCVARPRSGLLPASKTSERLALVTDILGGTAIVGAGISIYLTVSASSSSSAAKVGALPMGVRLTPTPGGGVLSCSFWIRRRYGSRLGHVSDGHEETIRRSAARSGFGAARGPIVNASCACRAARRRGLGRPCST